MVVPQALDFIIYAAQATGLKLILALGNFWDAFNVTQHGRHSILEYSIRPE
jgi:hypothetical protein